MTTLTGTTAAAFVSNVSSLATVAGNTFAASFPGYIASKQQFQVANGVFYVLQSGKIFSATEAGSWVQQVTASSVTSFVVDRATNEIYYTVGAGIYRASYSAAGSVSGVLVLDLTGSIPSPLVQTMDYNNAHSIIFTYLGSIFRYTNALSIP